jgi:hypothetical protein
MRSGPEVQQRARDVPMRELAITRDMAKTMERVMGKIMGRATVENIKVEPAQEVTDTAAWNHLN